MELDVNDFASYKELAQGVLSFAEKARKAFGRKLWFLLTAGDIAARKDFDSVLNLAAEPEGMSDAVTSLLGRLPVTSEEFDALAGKYRRMVFGTKKLQGLADSIQFRILEHMRDAIAAALEGRVTFADFQLKMQEVSTLPQAALRQIFDENVMQAYSAGSWERIYSYPENDELIFSAAADERTCRLCGGFDGFIARKSDSAWTQCWPPLHHRCRCTVRMAFDFDRDVPGRPLNVNRLLSQIPEDFRSWPGDGFGWRCLQNRILRTFLAI